MPAAAVEKDDYRRALRRSAGPVDIELLSRVASVRDVFPALGMAAEQKELRDVPRGAPGESQEPQKREVGMPYLGRGSFSVSSGRAYRPSRMSCTVFTRLRAALRTSSCTAASRSSASWLVA